MENEEHEKEIEMQQHLIDEGVLEIYGMSEDGEPVYRMNLIKLKKSFPPLYNEIIEEMDKDLMNLYEQGLVDVSYDENLDATFSLTPEAHEYLRSVGYDLPDLE
jgi:hypothetical protein